MTRSLKYFAMVAMAFLLSASAKAACGGGGYATAPARQDNNATRAEYRPSNAVSADVFDTSRFNSISGKLHLTYEQATKVIQVMNDVRTKAREAVAAKNKEYVPQKDFDKRLEAILDQQQFKDYLANNK